MMWTHGPTTTHFITNGEQDTLVNTDYLVNDN